MISTKKQLAFLWIGIVLLIANSAGVAAEPAAPPKNDDTKQADDQFIRVVRNEDGEPLAMETAIVRFGPREGLPADLTVDLIGAVHVGDAAYYERLNKLFESYDVVLYELVASEGTRVPKGGRDGGEHPITGIQRVIQTVLDLEFQLDHIDYTRPNMVHADMSPAEFAESMRLRDESFLKMYFRLIGQEAGQNDPAGGTGGTASFLAQLARGKIQPLKKAVIRQVAEVGAMSVVFSNERALRFKQSMAEEFASSKALMAFDGPDGSTIITERNKKALAGLDREIKDGKKHIAVFYGAGHLADMQKRMVEDHGMRREEILWVEAWSLRPRPAKSTPAAEAKKDNPDAPESTSDERGQ